MMNEMIAGSISTNTNQVPDKSPITTTGSKSPLLSDKKDIEANAESQNPASKPVKLETKTYAIKNAGKSQDNMNNSIRENTAVTAEAVNVPPKDKSHRCFGIFFALCATLCLSVSTFFVKILLKKGYSIYLSIFWRFLGKNNFQSPIFYEFILKFRYFAGVVIPSIPMLFFYRYYFKKPVFDSIWPLQGTERVAHWKNLGFIFVS